MPIPLFFLLLARLCPVWICFVLSYLLFRGLAAKNLIDKDRRVSWAFATVAAGMVFVLAAECASAARQLTAVAMWILWGLADAALLAAIVRLQKPAEIIAGLKETWRRFWSVLRTKPFSSPVNKTLFFLAAAMMLFLGAVALLSPTTNWDTLTYHMPRVMHWMQQQSMNHYPTNIRRQLDYAPGGEIQIATLLLLAGNDWPVNLPQWWAMLTGALAASFLAERLLQWQFGNKPLDPSRVKWCGFFAAVVAMTSPHAILQSSSAMNDLRTGMWMILLVLFGALLVQSPKQLLYAGGVAAAFALGVNNKATMCLYAAPFALALVFFLFGKSLRALFLLGAGTVVIGLALNGPWMLRNNRLFHGWLASPETWSITQMQNRNPAKIAANIFRDLSLYANTPFTFATTALDKLLNGAIRLTGEPLQDPDCVHSTVTFYFRGNSEIAAGDGFGEIVDVLPLFFAGVTFLAAFKWKSPLMVYLGLLTLGFAMMCGYLKWEPWQQRLHLVFLLLAAPFAGAVLGWVWNRWLVLAFSMLLVWNGALVIAYNHFDPIKDEFPLPSKSREERYFCFRPELYPSTVEVAQDLIHSGITNVLLKTGIDSWEYPLWVFLKDRGFGGTIHHVLVDDNPSASLPGPNFDLPGTAIVSEDVNLPPQSDFGLSVGYDSWNIHYRGNPENRMKLISNHASLGLMLERPARLQIRCHVMDQNGQPVTNNIIRMQTGDFTRDYPATAEEMVLECPLKAGRNLLTISCVNPPTPEQRILTLAGMTTRLQPP